MNPLGRGKDIYQEQLAKENRDTVIYALRNLRTATSTEIHNFIQVNRSKHNRIFSLRTVQTRLKGLVNRGFVIKNGNQYSLSPEGDNEKIFGYYYGRLLYQKLMEIPFSGSVDEKLKEYVRRVGIYITYVFMRNSNRAGIDSRYNAVRKEYDEWVNDCISPVVLLEWFNNVFYSKAGTNSYEKLKEHLSDDFDKYIRNLEESENMYYEKLFPSLQNLKKKGLHRREKSLDDS